MLLQPCGGAIPLCMIGEFDLPPEIVDRKVTKMKMISPSNHEVDVGRTLSDTEYIGMCRREVLDDYLRKRASSAGANLINGLFMRLEQVSLRPSQAIVRCVRCEVCTLSDTEYIGMCRREVLDDYLRKRASSAGANLINGLFMRLEQVSLRTSKAILRCEV